MVFSSRFIIVTAGILAGIGVWTWTHPKNSSPTDIARADIRSNIWLSGNVVDDVSMRLSGQQLVVAIRDTKWTGRLLVYVPLLPEIQYGDVIRFRCRPRAFSREEYQSFVRAWASQNVFSSCFAASVHVLGETSSIRRSLLIGKTQAIHKIQKIFPEPESSLLVGILMGAETGTPPDWQNALRRSGTAHIVVASGYNVTILFAFFTKTLSRWTVPRWRFIISVLAVGLFAVIAGFEASILRASIMGILGDAGKLLGRPVSSIRIFLLTIIGMTLVNPWSLIGDIGFQLSIAATAGLIFLGPWIDRGIQKIPNFLAFRDSLSTTLAASFAVTPLLWGYFHTFSWRGLLVNPLILWAVPWAMISGAVTLGIAFIFPSLVSVFAFVTWLPLRWMTTGIFLFS